MPVRPVPARRIPAAKLLTYRPPAVRWPRAGVQTVHVPAAESGAAATVPAPRDTAGAVPTPGSVRAGSLPVWLGPAAPTPAQTPAPAQAPVPAAVTVSMASHSSALAAGIRGVLLSLRQAAGPARAVHVSLSDASFADAYGGDYASRLRLVQLPGCALTSPRRAACRRQTPLASQTDVTAGDLGANVTIPAATTAGTVVIAATSGSSGGGGDYTATALSEAGNWAEGGSSGSFDYAYPITVPLVPGGLEPDVSLQYDSQSVDGLTSSTNNQASWIGDGWSYAPGYIQRSYEPCSQTSDNTGDECWSSNNIVTMTLGGQKTTLVQDSATGTWRAERDNGERISYDTSTSDGNGTHDGGYWVVTEPDGTQYYFGLNHLPGYASGDAATNSAWTLPVYATASGQPCYNATFSSSYCYQAWQWNLDYVVDSHSDTMAYFYTPETNYYARDNGSTGTANYTRGGYLTKIEYGQRAGSVYTTTPAAEVTFAVTGRCDNAQTCAVSSLSSSTASNWPDVPYDLNCTSGATCANKSPTFWSEYRLTGIQTEALDGSSLTDVDSWALAQTFPPTGDTTTPSLWLSTVTRTGEDGGSVTLPPETFTGRMMANRVNLTDGYPPITRQRLTDVTTETGETIAVNYSPPSCPATTPTPDANTSLCYPDYWYPPNSGADTLDWFNKYVVESVTQEDNTAAGLPVTTSYTYSGAAWHYNDDSLSRSSQRTWDQWRGFATVTTETGSAPDPVTETVDTYFQGMNGDYQAGGGTASASLTSSRGDTVTDSDQFAGQQFEETTYDGAGGAEVSDTITIPWSSAATATQSQPSPLPALTAYMTGDQETETYTPLASGGTRESDTTYTYDSYGRVTSESDIPDTSDPAEDTCTTTSYASNTSAWLLTLPAEVTVVSVPCGSTASLPADAVSDNRTYYDGSTTLGASPAVGDVTQTTMATSYNGSTPVFTTQGTATHDKYGRVLTSTDADGRTTTTGYTPATGAEPTSQTVTDPMGLVTTTTFDPLRELPLTVTDPAGYVTSQSYDALGRLTGVWKPGEPEADTPASVKYTYQISATSPSVVTTETLDNTGGYDVSETLYDALLREVETQTSTPDGGRDITDTTYNSDGWQVLTSSSYYTTGAPSAKLVDAPAGQVPSQTGYVYDGDGRVTRQISYAYGTEEWETDTSYGGDETTVTPPQGGTPETTFTNGEDLTSAIYQYHAGVPVSPSDPASDYDQTSYGYTPSGQLAQITDTAGNRWSYSYDLAGDRVSSTTPDAGTSTSTYDAAGQLMNTTDARGKTISYVYDADGRKIAEYDTTGGAGQNSSDELASWTYDTLAKGQITSSTSYAGGAAYTEAVTGYGTNELPKGTETIIPSAQGALAGTYVTQDSYNVYTQALSSYTDSAAGGLPAETVSIGYDSNGDPVSLEGDWDYVSSLAYTEIGQPQEYIFGPSSSSAWLINTWDPTTGRLSEAQTSTSASANPVDDTKYAYNADGQITSTADQPAGGATDQVQCFQYDYLGRLTEAWEQGNAGCASTPSQSAEGGAYPYWESFTYNDENDLTSETSTPPSGTATTDTNSYPAPGSSQPHAIRGQVASGPGGSTTTSYGYDADGNTTSVASPSTTQTLTWNDADQLSSDSTTATGVSPLTTSYIYDTDGNLLVQSDPGSTTLYLPDEQLVLNDSTGAVTGTRYYTIGGVTVAAQTTGGSYWYLAGNQQGTATIAISAATLAVTRRAYDPYGNALGTAPASWPGDKGFVGGTADAATGLTDLGARELSSGTGSFISTDAILDPTDPSDLNPYAYAADSPVDESDPTGLYHLCLSYCTSPPPSRHSRHSAPGPGQGPGPGPGSSPIGDLGDGNGYGPTTSHYPWILGDLYRPQTAPPPKFTMHPGTVSRWNPECGVLLYRVCQDAGPVLYVARKAQAAANAVGDASSNASALMRAGDSEGGSAMRALQNNTFLQRIAAYGRSDAAEFATRSLMVLGTGLNAAEIYSQTDSIPRTVIEALGDTAISYATTGVATAAGFSIGLAASETGVGPFVGAGLGAVLGATASGYADEDFNRGVNEISGWLGDLF